MRQEPVQKGPTQFMAKEIKGKAGEDRELIRELAQLLDETGLTEIEIDRDGMRVRVARVALAAAGHATSAAPAALQPAPDAEAKAGESDPAKHPGCVRSPMVGTAYLSHQPGAAPFVAVGSRVVQGQTILIIEAMKTMNHIPAPKTGVVTRILVGNLQPVEFGEPLAIIE